MTLFEIAEQQLNELPLVFNYLKQITVLDEPKELPNTDEGEE